MIINKANVVKLSFDNGASWIDVVSYVKPSSFSINIVAMNDTYHCSRNVANVSFIYDASLFSSINTCPYDLLIDIKHDHTLPGTVEVPVEVSQTTGDNVSYNMFKGKSPISFNKEYNGILYGQTISLEFTDSTDILDTASGDFVYRSTELVPYKVYDPADTTHSIGHLLGLSAGLLSSQFSNEVSIMDVVPAISPENEDDNILKILDTLFHEHGYVLHFDEEDKMHPIPWIRDVSESITFTFTNQNVVGEAKISRPIRSKYKGAEVIYYEIKEDVGDPDVGGVLLFQDSNLPYAQGGGFLGYTLPPNIYYPIAANAIDDTTGNRQIVYQEYADKGIKYRTNKAIVNGLDININAVSSDYSSIVATYDHILDWRADAGIILDTAVYDNKKAQVLFHNTGSVDSDIYYINIYGKMLYRSAERSSINMPASGGNKYKYMAQYISSAVVADKYVSTIANQFRNARKTIKLQSLVRVEVGALVKVTLDDGTDEECIVMSRSFSDDTSPIWSYVL